MSVSSIISKYLQVKALTIQVSVEIRTVETLL